jgi:hypothetical protein
VHFRPKGPINCDYIDSRYILQAKSPCKKVRGFFFPSTKPDAVDRLSDPLRGDPRFEKIVVSLAPK